MKPSKVLSLIGIAARGRNVVSGEFSTENAVRDGSACLVIIAEDASANTKKKFTDKCSYNKVPMRFYGTQETLGHAVGKQSRACIAVTDRGFADANLHKLPLQDEQ